MNIYKSPRWFLPSEWRRFGARAAELRFNPYHDEKGRFCSGNGLTSGLQSGKIKAGSEKVALEYQRYGRNKDTLVNKTYIDGGEYRRKFDDLSDNPAVNKALYECSKAALKHRSGTELEDMYWIDGKTGKIILSVTDSKEERAIIYTEKIKNTINL